MQPHFANLSSEVMHRIQQRFALLYGPAVAAKCIHRLAKQIGRYGVGYYGEEPGPLWTEKDAVLITYGDSIRTEDEPPLQTLHRFYNQQLKSAINTIHILPFCPYSSDDGFSVIDYREVAPQFGSWNDVCDLGRDTSLMFDLVLNHCSAKSLWFKEYQRGVQPGRDFFIALPPETDVSRVVRPRTHPLLTQVETRDGTRHVWTTFSDDQIDLNFANPDVLFEFIDIFMYYIAQGARIIRLDAVAFLWKELGTDCLHHPKTHEVVKILRDIGHMIAPQVILLTETNVPHQENISYFGDQDEAHMVYNFTLPPLLLHSMLQGKATELTEWAANLPALPSGNTFFNFTASHDGIGVRPLEGVISNQSIQALADTVQARGGRVNYRSNADGSNSPYELNITWYSALDAGDEYTIERFICSQALPMAMRGVPAIYIHTFTATRNDEDGLERTGQNRSINRMKWDESDLHTHLRSDDNGAILEHLTNLLELRAKQPAFHPDAEQRILRLDPLLFVVQRQCKSQTITAIHNLSNKTVCLDIPGTNLITGNTVSTLKAYEFAWLQS